MTRRKRAQAQANERREERKTRGVRVRLTIHHKTTHAPSTVYPISNYYLMITPPPFLALAAKLALVSLSEVAPITAVNTPHLRHHHHTHSTSHQGTSQSADTAGESSMFDFYVYSMTYQPEFCRENSERFTGCHHPQQYWEGQLTIHGLWPQRIDGTWPSECTSERLRDQFYISPEDASNSIMPELEEKWPNIKADSNSRSHTEFWEHEWDKHGTCSGLVQFDYFSKALGLLLETPSVVRQAYGSTVHKNELLDGYGGEKMASLVCKSGYLSEVRACFEKKEDGIPGERMECPESTLSESSCGEEINIASFDAFEAIVESVE
jgi:ribonuclease I